MGGGGRRGRQDEAEAPHLALRRGEPGGKAIAPRVSMSIIFKYCLLRTHVLKIQNVKYIVHPLEIDPSGSPHSNSCQRKTIGPTGPIFSAPLNEMHTEQ